MALWGLRIILDNNNTNTNRGWWGKTWSLAFEINNIWSYDMVYSILFFNYCSNKGVW